jgi:membrane peptidoglycan carboxypeptidase
MVGALLAFAGGMDGWAAYTVHRVSRPVGLVHAAASPAFLDATIAMEDGRFYQHGAFDWDALRRAVRVNLRVGRIVQGGSTITQQLAKNLFLSKRRTLWRKVQEAFLSEELERQWGKRRILESYVHVIDYGMGQHGIEQAARFYFQTTPDKLTLAQSALLVGMVPYAPRQWPSRSRLEEGRRTALDRLAYWFPGRYTSAQRDAARQVPLETLLPGMPRRTRLP